MAKGIQYRNRIDLSNAIRREIIKVPMAGFLQIVDASSSSATIRVALDNDVSDAKFFSMKKGGEIKDIDGFSKVYISCDAQPGEWVDLIIVEGSEDFSVKNPQEIVINSISNAIKVKNETGGSLEVNNPNIEALLKNDTDKRTALTTMENTSHFYQQYTGSGDIVTASSNINGIIIRNAIASAATQGNAAHASSSLSFGSNKILFCYGANAYYQQTVQIKDVYIPSGFSLSYNVVGTYNSCFLIVNYEVL